MEEKRRRFEAVWWAHVILKGRSYLGLVILHVSNEVFHFSFSFSRLLCEHLQVMFGKPKNERWIFVFIQKNYVWQVFVRGGKSFVSAFFPSNFALRRQINIVAILFCRQINQVGPDRAFYTCSSFLLFIWANRSLYHKHYLFGLRIELPISWSNSIPSIEQAQFYI